jgi:hypothetical protein
MRTFYLGAALRTLEEQHFQYLSVMWIWSIYQYSMTSWRDSHAAICFLCYDIGSKNGETVSSWCDCWVPGMLWTKTFAGVGVCLGNGSWVMKCHEGCFAIQSKCKRVTDGLRRKFVKQSYLNSCSLKRFQLPCHDWWTNGLVLQVDSRLLFGDSDRLLAGKLWQIMANCLLKLQGDCETKTTLNYKILVARTKLKFLISWKGKITRYIYIYYT